MWPVIITEATGKIEFESVVENVTQKVESDEATGLRDVYKRQARACEFLDGIKNLGYYMAFKGGLSFNLGDIIITKEKEELVKRGNE